MLITFEGGEGVGKTTQITFLKQTLEENGYDVVVTREPGGSPTAEKLRDVFVEQKGQNWDVVAQTMLMFTARRLHIKEVIEPALAADKIVLCDRFTDSTRAYQGYAGGLDTEKFEAIKQASIGDFEAHLTFVFDLDPKIGLSRAKSRAGEQDTFEDKALKFHEDLRNAYLDIATQNKDRCIVIDASDDMDTIRQNIWTHVKDRVA